MYRLPPGNATPGELNPSPPHVLFERPSSTLPEHLADGRYRGAGEYVVRFGGRAFVCLVRERWSLGARPVYGFSFSLDKECAVALDYAGTRPVTAFTDVEHGLPVQIVGWVPAWGPVPPPAW